MSPAPSAHPKIARQTTVCWGERGGVWSSRRRRAHALGRRRFASDASSSGTVGTDKRLPRIGYLTPLRIPPAAWCTQKYLWTLYGLHAAEPVRFRSWNSLIEAFIAGRVGVIHLLMPMALYMRYHLRVPAKVLTGTT